MKKPVTVSRHGKAARTEDAPSRPVLSGETRALIGALCIWGPLVVLPACGDSSALQEAERVNTSALSSAPPVLPHRSRNATGSAATGFYSTGSSHGQISYHGGPLLTGTVNAYFIWYGAWAAEDRAILETLISQLSSSQYFHINDSYHDASLLHHPSQVRLAGFTSDNYSWGTTVDDNAIFAIVSGAIAGGQMQVLFPFPTGAVDPNGVYFVLTSPDVTVLDGFCSENCGWHGSRLTGGQQIKYAFVGNSGWQCPDACEEQTGSSPNDNPGIDGMASVMVHELKRLRPIRSATDGIRQSPGSGKRTPTNARGRSGRPTPPPTERPPTSRSVGTTISFSKIGSTPPPAAIVRSRVRSPFMREMRGSSPAAVTGNSAATRPNAIGMRLRPACRNTLMPSRGTACYASRTIPGPSRTPSATTSTFPRAIGAARLIPAIGIPASTRENVRATSTWRG